MGEVATVTTTLKSKLAISPALPEELTFWVVLRRDSHRQDVEINSQGKLLALMFQCD